MIYMLIPVAFIAGIIYGKFLRNNDLLMDAENCRTKIRGEWFILDRVTNDEGEWG